MSAGKSGDTNANPPISEAPRPIAYRVAAASTQAAVSDVLTATTKHWPVRRHAHSRQLSIAVEAAREVAGNESDECITFFGDIHRALHERLLRVQFAVHISGDAVAPIFFRSPVCGPNMCHFGNVEGVSFAVDHGH